MKESKAYKTYLGYATGSVPPKVARKFKKASPSKKDSIVIREPPVETQSKRKEKVDVACGKGIDLLSEVALTEEAQMKEVRKKSLRDFHKSHPSVNDDDDEDDDNDDDKSEGEKNLEITQEQVVKDAHVTITKNPEVPVTSSSRSSDLASKFLNFLDIPPADTEIVSPLDVHVHHKVLDSP
nr:hypothetical protein [Tanacetum cinerariifolium]